VPLPSPPRQAPARSGTPPAHPSAHTFPLTDEGLLSLQPLGTRQGSKAAAGPSS